MEQEMKSSITPQDEIAALKARIEEDAATIRRLREDLSDMRRVIVREPKGSGMQVSAVMCRGSEIAELRKDKDRLDWLIDIIRSLQPESDGVSGFHLNGDVATWDEVDIPLTRDAIDAAMQIDSLEEETVATIGDGGES